MRISERCGAHASWSISILISYQAPRRNHVKWNSRHDLWYKLGAGDDKAASSHVVIVLRLRPETLVPKRNMTYP